MITAADGESHDQREQRRVRVWFGTHCMCDYRADPLAAERYADAMGRRYTGLSVSIEQTDTTGLKPLPCELLWSLAP